MKNIWGRGAKTLLLNGKAHVAPLDGILPRGACAAIIVAVFSSCLSAFALTPPANDNFTNAIVLSGSLGTATGTNLNATLQSGETNQVFINQPGDYDYFGTYVPIGSSVWFQWTATNSGYVTFDTVGSVDNTSNTMATVLAAWTGNNISNLTLIAGGADIEDDINNDINPVFATNNPNSIITFYAQSNVTYSISVDLNLHTAGLPGSYVLNWDAIQPANDISTNIPVIGGSFGSVSGNNFNATLPAGTTNQVYINDDVFFNGDSIDVSNSSFFEWTAPQSGLVTFNTIGSTDLINNPMDTVLAVWTGNSVSNLTLVASDDDTYDDLGGFFDDPNSTVTLPVVAGQNYYIAAYLDGDDGGNPGNYVLNWNAVAPVNTNFANAAVLSDYSGTLNETNLNSTLTTNVLTTDSGSVGVGNGLLFQWTPSQNGYVTFNTTNSTDELGNPMDTVLAVYALTSPGTYTLVTADDNIQITNLNSALTFYASENVTYYIVAGVNQSAGGLAGNVVLNWDQAQAGAPTTSTFQFTSSQYQFSQNEDNGPNHAEMTAIPARASITRIGGAEGMTDISYYFTNTWYTNWTQKISYTINSVTNVWTNGIATFNNYTVVPENHIAAGGTPSDSFPVPTNAVNIIIYTVTNLLTTNIGVSLPVYISTNTSPQAPYVYGGNTLLLSSNLINGVSTLVTSGGNVNWSVIVSNSTSSSISFNLVIDVQTTNSAFVEVATNNGISNTNDSWSAYQDYSVNHGFYYVTQTNSGNSFADFGNGVLTTNYSTNNQPFVLIPSPSFPPWGISVNTNYAPVFSASGASMSTNLLIATNVFGLGPITNANGEVDFITNYYTYSVLFVSDVVSTYLGNDFLFPSGPQTAVFNDYQMNYDISIPTVPDNTTNLANPLALVVMTGASLDQYEDPNIPAPQVSSKRNVAFVSFFNPNAIDVVSTPAFYANVVYGDMALTTNVFNFERSTLRCDKTVGGGEIAYIGVICPNHTDNSTANVNYRIDYRTASDNNNSFRTEAGSEYARPDDPASSIYTATNDFTSSSGVVSFPPNAGTASVLQYIPVPITQDSTVKFNQDIFVTLYYPQGVAPGTANGMNGYIGAINYLNLTILMTTPPAGAVDTSYMAENNIVAADPEASNPGANGQVNAIAVQPNGYAVVGGDFTSFTALSGGAANYIARLDSTGWPDPSFNTGGASGGFQGGFAQGGTNAPVVNALALDTNENIVAGGEFTSFNGTGYGGITRLLPSGAADPTFNNYGTGASSNVWAVAIQTNGQIIIAGDFTTYNGTNTPYIARLNTDGSLDTTFNAGINPPNGSIYSVAIQTNGAIVIGGAFTQVGSSQLNYIARLNPNGSLDNTFSNLNLGPNDDVRAVAVQNNGLILLGGQFTSVDGIPSLNYLARLNPDGSVDSNFASGTGPNDSVWSILPQNDGTFYIGGYFTIVNETRRCGIARMLPNGWVDTSFMDTANNQFAGLVNPYYSNDPFWDESGDATHNPVFAIAIEPVQTPFDMSQTNDVLIGGSFSQVGGDGGLTSPNYTCNFDRELVPGGAGVAVHPRNNIARLIGGSTPGPGNVQFTQSSYSGNNVSPNQFIQLIRTNGTLGTAAATFAPVQSGTGSGYAAQGVDYNFNATAYLTPTWGVTWGIQGPATWMLEDGLYGINNYETSLNPGWFYNNPNPVFITIISNNYPGSVTVNLQLSYPKDQDTFFLGGNAYSQAGTGGFGNPATEEGENIPLGVALGSATVPLIINHLTGNEGTFNFSSSYYYAPENSGAYTITVTRSGGSDGTARVNFKTSNGTAIAGTDYTTTNGTLTFGQGVTSQNIYVPIINYHANQPDRIFDMSLSTPSGGATLGTVTNAQVEIVNDNIASGFAEFVNGVSATNTTMYYGVNASAGQAQIPVARLGGSTGILQVTVQTNGTALYGTNYIGATTNLLWPSSDTNVVQMMNIKIPPLNMVGTNALVKLVLSNPVWGNGPSTNLLGTFTNAWLIITNNSSSGLAEFTSPNYSVNEYAGYAIIPVTRSGGSAGNLSVQIFTLDGTATNGINYQPINTTIQFAPGQVSTNFIVGISNLDSATNLNFFIVLSNAVPTNGLGSPNIAEVTIDGSQVSSQPPGQPDGTFNASFNGPVLSLALQTNGQILAGGEFTLADGLTRQYVARLNTDGSLDKSFSSYLPTYGGNAPVNTILIETNVVNPNLILAGGQFTEFDGSPRNYLARLNVNGSLDSGFNIGSAANNPIYALAQTPTAILVGGAFTSFESVPANGIVQLLTSGTVDTSFNASANATVYAIAVQPNGQVLIGGDFTNVDGVPVNHVARLNANGSLDYGFTNASSSAASGANASVHAIAIQLDGRILIGGSFTNVDGVPCNYIARLNQDGTLDSSFTNALTNAAIGANGAVSSIVLQPDARILVGGSFTEFNGVNRNRITRLNPNGGTDYSINFGIGADGAVNATVLQNDGNIVLGGAFLNYDGQSYPYIVRIFGGSEAGSGSFEFQPANYQISENGISEGVNIIRNGGTSGPNPDGSGNVSVNFSTDTNNSTAVPGVNYSPVSTTVTFPPGESVETVYVPILNDIVTSPASWSVSLDLTNPQPSSAVSLAGNYTNGIITILNTTAFISFSSSSYNVPDNTPNGEANITLTLQGYTNATSSVVFSTTGGSAVPGIQYMPVPPTTVTFNPGVSSLTVPVYIVDNTNYAGNQTVTMALTNASNAYLSPPTNATLNIINTVNAYGQIYIASSNYTFNLSSGQAVVTVVYTNGNNPVSVGYYTMPGSALPGQNYTPASGTLSFGGASGITSTQIDIPLLANAGPQGPVTFSLVLSNAPNGQATLIPPTNTTITIVDDLNSGVAFGSPTNYFAESAGTIAVPVLRYGNLTNSFSVAFTTTNGSALAGVNYVSNSGTLNFLPNVTQNNIAISLLNNEDVSNLQFGIVLFPTNGVQLSSPSNTIVVETPAAAGLTFASPTNFILKNGLSVTIPVICLDPSNEPVIINSNTVPLSVNFTTTNGTALAGADYVATNGTLIFTNGIVTNYVTVGILDNSLITGQRTFGVNLSNPAPVPPAKLVSPTNELITIIDNNSGLSFSSLNYSVNGGGLVPIEVVRVDNTNTTSTVSFSTVGGGSAVPTNDYQPTSGMLTFAPGQVTNFFAVDVFGSSAVQPNKTIILELFNPTNGVLTPPDVATLTIYNQNGSDVVPVGVSLARTNDAPNGILQSNQMAYLWFGFRDAGGLNVSNLYATLLSSANIQPTNIISGGSIETESYGPLIANGPSASQEFTLTPIGTNGQTVPATFALEAVSVNNTTNYETNSFSLTIGSWTTTFYNTNPIYINPATAVNQTTNATPYPSIITVSNVGGVLISAAVTVTNWTTTSPQAVGVLVVAPQFEDTLLMSSVGSADVGATNVTLIFSDAATNYVPYALPPNQVTITNGYYKPTQNGSLPMPNFP